MIKFKDFINEEKLSPSDLKIKKTGNATYTAYHKRKVVGKAIVDYPRENQPENSVSIFKMTTHPEYRHRNVMKHIYNHIENDTGKRVVPSTALTDDGFNFWKKYKPDEVKNDLRMHTDKLMGKEVEGKSGKATIHRVGSRGVMAKYSDSETTTYKSRADLVKSGHIKE
jgi:hypothetical protein